MVHSYCGTRQLSKRIKIKCTVHPWTTQVCPVWVYLHKEFFYLYFCFTDFLIKCGGEFVFNQKSQYVESNKLRSESWFYTSCFSFLPLDKSFINSLFSNKNSSMQIFFFFYCVGVCTPKPPIFQGSTIYFRAKRFKIYGYMKKGTNIKCLIIEEIHYILTIFLR